MPSDQGKFVQARSEFEILALEQARPSSMRLRQQPRWETLSKTS